MPLLYVLWTVSLLTIIAVATQSSGTLSYKLVRNAADIAQQDAFAEATLNRAILSLLDNRSAKRLAVDGSAETFTFKNSEVTVHIQDEQGRIDINHADATLLANLFRAASVPTQKADRLADRILDWRDPDHLKRLNGAEQREYQQAGLPYRPRNGAFSTVKELRLVLGMTPDIFQRVQPALTVYSGKPMIDPRVAPTLARHALSGGIGGLPTTKTQANQMKRSLMPLAGRAYSVRITFSWRQIKSSRTAVIRFRSGKGLPYWLLRWQ